jgi:hypothetical protein
MSKEDRDGYTYSARPIPKATAYVLRRSTHTDGSINYEIGFPSSEIHHPHNVVSKKFDEHIFLTWGTNEPAKGEYDMPQATKEYHTANLAYGQSWNPNKTLIIQGPNGDRLIKRNVVNTLGKYAARQRLRFSYDD